MKLDGYIRVSDTRGREDTLISPELQRQQIEAWASLRTVEIADWQTDLDISGGKLTRPGLDAILARIQTGATGGIAVATLDRLSRADVGDALNIIREIHEAGGQIAIVDLGIDPATTFGEFGMTIMLALARMQLRQITERWHAAKGNAIGRGVHFRPPFGYEKPAPGQPIRINPDHAPHVKHAFQMRADGEPWAAIVRYLNAHCQPRNAKQWTHGTVQHLIRNRAYLGEAYHSGHRLPEAHDAIVTPALFDAANAVKGVRAASRNGGEGHLLNGLIRCAGCSHTMTFSYTQSGRKVKQTVYRCRRHHGQGSCPAPTAIDAARIESFVESWFWVEHGEDLQQVGPERQTVALDDALSELADAEHELSVYLADATLRKRLGDTAWQSGVDARIEAVENARERVQQARSANVGFSMPQRRQWDDMSTSKKRALLAQGVGAVFVRRSVPNAPVEERVKVLRPDELERDLPGRARGGSSPLARFEW